MNRDIIREFLNESYGQFAGKDAISRALEDIRIILEGIEYGTEDMETGFVEIRKILDVIESESSGTYRSGDESYS